MNATATARPTSRTLHALGPDLIALGVFGTLLAVLMWIYGGHFSFVHGSTLMPLGAMLILVAISVVAGRQEPTRILRDWSPLVAIILIYGNFHDLTHLIRPDTVDATLRRLDVALLGVEPSLAMQRITTPWLTEYMTFSYALFFVFPMIILVRLYASGDHARFREFGLALSFGFYLGLIGYMSVPAIGPRYALASEFHVQLHGPLTDFMAAAWNTIEKVERDCFPSLHTAMSTISLIYFWRLRRSWRGGHILFWISAPLVVSLWMSTLYLRYHYAVNVVAGWALAFVCTAAAPALTRWYHRRQAALRTTAEM